MTEVLAEATFLHNLKNPLTIALGQCRILMTQLQSDKPPPTADVLVRLQKMATAMQRIDAMIDERRAPE